MKKFSVWFFSLIVLFYSFASAVPVKASAPSSYQVDYSSLYSASDIAGILPTLTSSAAGGFFATLGSLAYSYLRSVNVNIVPSSSMSPTDAMITLGKKVIETVTDVTQPNRLLWKGLNSGTQYLVTSLLKDAQSGDLTQSNYSDQVFVWKDQVSKPMSDIFNVFDPVTDLWSPDPEAFHSASNSLFSDVWLAPLSAFSSSSVNVSDAYNSVHFNFPTAYSVSPFSSSDFYVTSFDSVRYGSSDPLFSFDSIIFFDNFSFDGNTYVLLNSSGDSLISVNSSRQFPFIFFNSVSQTFYCPSSTGDGSFLFFSTSSVSSLTRSGSSYLAVSKFLPNMPIRFNRNNPYVLSDYINFFLSYSSSVPSSLVLQSSFYRTTFSNINVYVASFDSYHHCYLSDLKGYSSVPTVSIDASNNYVDRQLPIDNVDNTEATLNLASVIDNLAGSIDGTLSNIDFLTDAINGLVGTVPQVSVDAWNPDRVSEHVSSTDIASAIDGVASLEGTFTDNVQPVFDSFPLFPFIAPIWNTFQQYPVIGLITACIFLVVLFGFLNKLLF